MKTRTNNTPAAPANAAGGNQNIEPPVSEFEPRPLSSSATLMLTIKLLAGVAIFMLLIYLLEAGK